MKKLSVILIGLGMSFSLASAADEYAYATMGMSATMVPLSRAVCHRATGNLSSCTNTLSCGSYTLWPPIRQLKEFKKYSGKIVVYTKDQSRKLCRLK